VEYASSPFLAEVQRIDVTTNVTREVQVVTTATNHSIPEVQLLYLHTAYNRTDGRTVPEVQTVVCDASSGFFRLSFCGYTTQPILSSADAAAVKEALQQLEIVNAVDVVFVGSGSSGSTTPTTACFSRKEYPYGGFNVSWRTANSVLSISCQRSYILTLLS
jgi:hypothetical protein